MNQKVNKVKAILAEKKLPFNDEKEYVKIIGGDFLWKIDFLYPKAYVECSGNIELMVGEGTVYLGGDEDKPYTRLDFLKGSQPIKDTIELIGEDVFQFTIVSEERVSKFNIQNTQKVIDDNKEKFKQQEYVDVCKLTKELFQIGELKYRACDFHIPVMENEDDERRIAIARVHLIVPYRNRGIVRMENPFLENILDTSPIKECGCCDTSDYIRLLGLDLCPYRSKTISM